MRKLLTLFTALLFVGTMWALEKSFDKSGFSSTDKTETKAPITVTFDEVTINNQQIRFSSGKKMVVSAASGYEMSEISVATNSSENYISPLGHTVSTGTWSRVSDKNYKWTGTASSVTFTPNSAIRITTVTVTYAASSSTTCADPSFSVEEGNFIEDFNLELSCTTEGASIYYTTDGTNPTTSSTLYNNENPIAISATTTVKAFAVKAGLDNSQIVSATYTKVEPVTTTTIDFETNNLSLYVKWKFENIGIHTATITAHGGSYYGSNVNSGDNATQTASITSKEAIANPQVLRFYISKESTNTTESTWNVAVSDDNSVWTDVASFDATDMSKGEWLKCEADLTSYTNVYVRISYAGSGAKRAIDDIEFITPPTYASLQALVAAEVDAGTIVVVSFSDIKITDKEATGVYLNVKDKDGENDIELYSSANIPNTWNINGAVSGSSISGTWKYFSEDELWYLTVANWDAISYKAYTALEWDAATGTGYTVGKENVLPTLTITGGITPSYTSSDPLVASIDDEGNVTVNKAGSTTITASYAGDATHLAAEDAAYTLTTYAPEIVVISGEATKTAYEKGDAFEHVGLVATVAYGDLSELDVTDLATWTTDLTDNKVEAAGEVTITATWQGLSDDATVAVTLLTHEVTFDDPENGDIVVKANGVAISTGDHLLKGDVITVEDTPDSGFALATLNAVTTSATTDIKESKSFTIGTEDVEIVAVFSKATALEDVETSVKAVKLLRNGILLIEKNGHTYNAMGQLVK